MDNALTRLSWYCDSARQRCHYSGAYNAFYSHVVWDRARRETVAYVSNSTLQPWRTARLTRDLVDVLAGRRAAPEPAPVLTLFNKAGAGPHRRHLAQRRAGPGGHRRAGRPRSSCA